MGTYLDKRTFAGLTSGNTATYPHGLGKTPDQVNVRYIATLATTTNFYQLNALADISNVTIQNAGATTSPNFEVCAIVGHLVIS